MGNTFCCPGSRHGNRVLPTNSTVLVLGLDNKDLVSYRRHRKKDDAELGCSVAASTSTELSKEGNSKQQNFEGVHERKPDREMQEWLGYITVQNHLLPSSMTFDNKRHLSMRSKYADVAQMINLSSIINETEEEHGQSNFENAKEFKKTEKQFIKKHMSYETHNLGLGPTPKLSTRISKDAVKTNRQKDNTLKYHGSRSPPPPITKPLSRKAELSESVLSKNAASKGVDSSEESQKPESANSSKHFHVSSDWLDEDFEESILSYPKEIPRSAEDIPQCSTLPRMPAKEDRGKKSIKFKIEPEISEPAVHNLGFFLSAVEEDQSEPKPRGRFWNVFKKKNAISITYAAREDLALFNESDEEL